MFWRRRIRRVLKWAGLVGCVLLLAAWIASFSISLYPHWFKGDEIWLFGVGGGAVEWYYRAGVLVTRTGEWFHGRLGVQWWPRIQPISVGGGTCWYVCLPLWVPLTILMALTAVLWYRDRRRPPSFCDRCGYDLIGNVSVRCPECGEPTATRSSGVANTRRRSTAIRVVKWAATTTSVVIGLTWIATTLCLGAWVRIDRVGATVELELFGGALEISHGPPLAPGPTTVHSGFHVDPSGPALFTWGPTYADLPVSEAPPGSRLRVLTVPLWIPLALLGLPTLYLWWLDRRRIPPGHCRKCAYDLTGNVTGRCPECGEPPPRAAG